MKKKQKVKDESLNKLTELTAEELTQVRGGTNVVCCKQVYFSTYREKDPIGGFTDGWT